MRELREMIAQLMQAQKGTPPPTPEDPNEAKAAEDKREGDQTSTSNSNADGKPDHKEVPYWYSPNPHVPDRKSVV